MSFRSSSGSALSPHQTLFCNGRRPHRAKWNRNQSLLPRTSSGISKITKIISSSVLMLGTYCLDHDGCSDFSRRYSAPLLVIEILPLLFLAISFSFLSFDKSVQKAILDLMSISIRGVWEYLRVFCACRGGKHIAFAIISVSITKPSKISADESPTAANLSRIIFRLKNFFAFFIFI